MSNLVGKEHHTIVVFVSPFSSVYMNIHNKAVPMTQEHLLVVSP